MLSILFALLTMGPAAQAAKPQVMIVGVAHLQAKRDLHNATWGRDVFDPQMQTQIRTIVARLARFKPTKVMIEAEATNPVYVQRYASYLRGTYQLGPNEDDQFGYRLAKIAGLRSIDPIDSIGSFPFDYDKLQAAAAAYGEKPAFDSANAGLQSLVDRSNALERESRLVDLLEYLNTPEALRLNAAWYLDMAAIGNPPNNYAGAELAAYWYARNLNIFANITNGLRPGDRAIVFIGQGHAAMLRPMLDNCNIVEDLDPLPFLRGTGM